MLGLFNRNRGNILHQCHTFTRQFTPDYWQYEERKQPISSLSDNKRSSKPKILPFLSTEGFLNNDTF